MTQDKAPKWALKQARAVNADIVNDDGNDVQTIALALYQAYERGQGSMRERAATVAFDAMFDQVDAFQARKLQTEIRSLPIEQEGGK